jgi:hypothetical protein
MTPHHGGSWWGSGNEDPGRNSDGADGDTMIPIAEVWGRWVVAMRMAKEEETVKGGH